MSSIGQAPPAMRMIAPMPRLRADGAGWIADVRRLESLGFDTVAVSQHVSHGWQLAPLVAMAYAAAGTTRLRVLSLVLPNDLHHPALLAKDISTIDVLSGGRVEVGIGAGWQPDDYAALGLRFDTTGRRIARLDEALTVLRRYFTAEFVDFEGEHYRIGHMEALPRCVQQPNPPILVGAGGPRMLELAGRAADIVGIHPNMHGNKIDEAAIADLAPARIETKIERVRAAADAAERDCPVLQFSCYHVRVTDTPSGSVPRSSWAAHIEAAGDALTNSPAILVGTAAECAAQLFEWRERFGITYWHLGQDVEGAARIIEELHAQSVPIGMEVV
ncbi:luciferase-like protein [Rhodococcus aetherivorans]|uniref:Luciferase-like protein n=3 Tax=Rhodococcus aetherivorans TaxID=191292 RepID=A0ABQ0YT97_9NOCA|nr:putative oxidoreductase [Rhodococcus rhodochrous ATCC 21198]GES39674.1 luciferase-like protein [Rhodococcus aetherivorans]